MTARPRKLSGQTMTEYILLVGLIALACIAAVKFFGHSVEKGFQNAGEQVAGATGGK